jgi:hypothetical protein
MARDDRPAMFPPFVGNAKDPLFLFSDGVFHQQCFVIHPLARDVQARLSDLRERTGPGHRTCAVCSEEIRNADEYVGFGFIASEPETVRRLNYLQFHRGHLRDWDELAAAHETLTVLLKSGDWEGPGVGKLVGELDRALRELGSSGQGGR